MTTEYSISVDDWRDERWAMTGREIMYSLLSEDGTAQNKEIQQDAKDIGCDADTLICGRADENCPMMNYAYPLNGRPSDEQIIEICEETNCTVVEDTKTGDFFLALSGGGMDLSQDVAMAYIIAENHVPPALALNVSTQEGLSTNGKAWLKVMRYCRKSLLGWARGYRNQVKQISEATKEYRKRKALEKPNER